MRKVTYSMSSTLDGYITGPDGGIDWSVPDPAVFALSMEEIRGVGVHLMGRLLYETMLYWETADPATFDEAEREWADLWNPLPKVVFSRTLDEVHGSGARLASGGLTAEIERLRAENDEGDIAIGGATLAAQAADLDLIDEYLVRVHPVLVGGGTPFHARGIPQIDLELVETRTFDSGVVFLRHRVKR
jgi:dihydrofolate reductase